MNKIQSLLQEYNKLKPVLQEHLLTFNNKTEKEKYHEFMFCLLTPQSNAKTCWEAVQIIIKKNPANKEKISEILRGRARFHNVKALRILKAKSNWTNVKSMLNENKDLIELRNEIAKNVDGYGLKEAGHFLRNIGMSNSKIAILDRHILKNLALYGAIKEDKIKNDKEYLELEQQALKFSQKLEIPIDEIDLLFWHKEHGEFFK